MDRLRTDMDKMTTAAKGTTVSQIFRTPCRTERTLRLWVDRIGEKTDWGLPERFRVLGLHGVVGVSGGSGVFEDVRRGPRPVAAGDCMLLFPSVPHRYGCPLGHWSTFWIVWGGELASALEGLGLVDPDDPVVRDQDGTVREAFGQLHPLMVRGDPGACLARLGVLSAMLTSLYAQRLRPVSVSSGRELADRVAAFLDTHYLERIAPHEIARRFAVSHSHLRRLFRAAMGQSVKEYVTNRRLSLAKRLLAEGGRTVKQVAAAAGYDDPCYFMRAFRRQVGVSPGRFR
jgi:AraC-like DNA-binding protein